VEDARALLGTLLDDVEGLDDQVPIALFVTLLQAAIVLQHREAVRSLAGRLACVANLTVAEANLYTCVSRHLGDAAKLGEDHASARAYYLRALVVAGEIRFRPEIALAHLRLAELELEESDDWRRGQSCDTSATAGLLSSSVCPTAHKRLHAWT
jgi:hypothetical protein